VPPAATIPDPENIKVVYVWIFWRIASITLVRDCFTASQVSAVRANRVTTLSSFRFEQPMHTY